jgi:hypothetical protein
MNQECAEINLDCQHGPPNSFGQLYATNGLWYPNLAWEESQSLKIILRISRKRFTFKKNLLLLILDKAIFEILTFDFF